MNISNITKRARNLRNNPTDAEKKLWSTIKLSQMGLKFRRQYPIGPYFADIVCKEKKLVIEIDGGQHNEITDRKRTEYIEQQGYRVMRFWNDDVLKNIEGVMMQLSEILNAPPLTPPQAGGDECSLCLKISEESV